MLLAQTKDRSVHDVMACFSFQVISYGFILHEGSFCRSNFNLLDMLVVAVSILAIVFRYIFCRHLHLFS